MGRGAHNLETGGRPMNQLLLLFVAGVVLFVLFLVLSLTGRPRMNSDPRPLAELERIVPLNGLVFNQAEVLLNPGDYQMLRSHAGLQRVARELRRDRRDIVLLWLRLLQKDILNLWRFRRLLVRSGAPAGLAEEFHVATASMLILGFLLGLRVIVAVVGPFAMPQLIRLAKGQAENTYQASAALLARLPSGRLAELESQWIARSGAAP